MPTISQTIDYKHLLSEVIRKQIIILGPDITLAKIKKIQGLSVEDTGLVTSISANKQTIMKRLVGEFIQYSGPIVKNMLEPFMQDEGSTSTKTSSTIELPEKQ